MIFRILVTLLVLLALVAQTGATPCGPNSTAACEINKDTPAPYSGTLMKEHEVWGLIDKVLDAEAETARAQAETNIARADATVYRDLYFKAKAAIGPAFYETPWFWLGILAAGGAGVALGLNLSK